MFHRNARSGLGVDRHDPPHRPAAGALDAGQQLHLPCPAAAAVVLGVTIGPRHSGWRQQVGQSRDAVSDAAGLVDREHVATGALWAVIAVDIGEGLSAGVLNASAACRASD